MCGKKAARSRWCTLLHLQYVTERRAGGGESQAPGSWQLAPWPLRVRRRMSPPDSVSARVVSERTTLKSELCKNHTNQASRRVSAPRVIRNPIGYGSHRNHVVSRVVSVWLRLGSLERGRGILPRPVYSALVYRVLYAYRACAECVQLKYLDNVWTSTAAGPGT